MSEPIHALFSTPEMTAVFSAESHVRNMLAFEAALAHAEARAGIIPIEAADTIAASCLVQLFNVAEIYHEAAIAGTPAIPLVRKLTAHVRGDAKKYVHWGATSQDAIDTATALQMRDGLKLIVDDLMGLCDSCAALAGQHRRTPMAGRTLLQQALPITFGLKAARWLALVARQVRSLRESSKSSIALQFGGAAGTLAALSDSGLRVADFLGEELGLPVPDLPWHAERDRIAAIAAALAVTAGSVAKIANDIVLLAQTEVGEVSEAEAPGKGGSSAMPQKRNPVDAVAALAASRGALGAAQVILSAMVNEHERAAGAWQTEWTAVPDLFCYAAGAVSRVKDAVKGLRVDAGRMRANLGQSGGLLMAESLTMAIAPALGRPEAQRLVQELCGRAALAGVTLGQLAIEDGQLRSILSPVEIELALDPTNYLGSADVFIDRALESHRELKAAKGPK